MTVLFLKICTYCCFKLFYFIIIVYSFTPADIIGVASSGPPGGVVVKVLTPLAVLPGRVVQANTSAVNLQTDIHAFILLLIVNFAFSCNLLTVTRENKAHLGHNQFRPVKGQLGPYHASLGEDVAPPAVHWGALAGVSIAETAASHHHVVESVVIFILRVPALPAQQGVAKSEEATEVHADVCHQDQI